MPAKTLMTAAEFAQTGPETDYCELIRGQVVPVGQPKPRHGEVCMNVGVLLKLYVKSLGHGTVIGNDSGIITERDPDTVRGTDVAVFLRPSWKGGPAPDEYVNEPADLMVEVRSPSQTWPKIIDKVSEYLAMGCCLVCVVDPQRKRVTFFDQTQQPQVFAAENELDGGDVLPGFRCRVLEFFE